MKAELQTPFKLSDNEQPRNETESMLAEIWKAVLEVNEISVEEDFFESGGDSLSAVELFSLIEKHFTLKLRVSVLFTHPTIRELAKVINQESADNNSSNVIVLQDGDSQAPLFCLYGILLYMDLAKNLDTNRMVCGVYLQEELSIIEKGCEGDEFEVFARMENIVDLYLNSICCYQSKGPYYLCGASFGGVVALEVARKLQARGEVVNLVAMFDSSSPGFVHKRPKHGQLKFHLQQIMKKGWPYLRQRVTRVWQSSSKSMIDEPNKNKTPDHHFGARKIRKKVYSSYQPKTYSGKVTLFKSTDRPGFELGSYALGWDEMLTQLEVVNIKGDHLGILQPPNVNDLASSLSNKNVLGV